MAKKKSELREMGIRDIEEELNAARAAYFKLRCQYVTGELENAARLKHSRREIARLITILSEKRRQQAAAAQG